MGLTTGVVTTRAYAEKLYKTYVQVNTLLGLESSKKPYYGFHCESWSVQIGRNDNCLDGEDEGDGDGDGNFTTMMARYSEAAESMESIGESIGILGKDSKLEQCCEGALECETLDLMLAAGIFVLIAGFAMLIMALLIRKGFLKCTQCCGMACSIFSPAASEDPEDPAGVRVTPASSGV
jgi:hypothetical protein